MGVFERERDEEGGRKKEREKGRVNSGVMGWSKHSPDGLRLIGVELIKLRHTNRIPTQIAPFFSPRTDLPMRTSIPSTPSVGEHGGI